MALKNDTDQGRRQAQAQLASVREMVKALRLAEESDDQDAIDAARQSIEQDALEASVRCMTWTQPGQKLDPDVYRVLLCWGGPAVQITGEIGQFGEPHDANLEYQDWGTPWTPYYTDDEETEDLLTYALQFGPFSE